MKALALAVLAAAAVAWPLRAAAVEEPESPTALEAYRIKARQQLDLIGDKLSALELESRVEQKRARGDLEARTAELRVEKTEADRLLSRIDSGTGDERRAARAKLDDALQRLKSGIEKAQNARRDWGSSRPRPPVAAPLSAYS